MITAPRVTFSFSANATENVDATVVLCHSGFGFEGALQSLDQKVGGALQRAVSVTDFDGSSGDVDVVAPAGTNAGRIILLGAGKKESTTGLSIAKLGARLCSMLNDRRVRSVEILCGDLSNDLVIELAHGLELRSYRFDKYLTREDENAKPSLANVVMICGDEAGAQAAFEPKSAAAAGNRLARDLVHEAPNVLYPVSYAAAIQEQLEPLGVEVTVLNEDDMAEWGALIGVGQGSIRESRCVVMHWRGADDGDNAKPVAFVGKGVTFDTGGISIKPSAGMGEMKTDMGGSAAVVGLMRALAGRKAKVNAIGIVGLVENMPDAAAQRPGDVVTSLSGQTIQVLNTDAEGRLVLADVLTHVQRTYKPRAIVDLATLTGAMIVALGHEKSGLFANDDDLARQLYDAGEATGEHLWRMPMGQEYNKKLDTKEADMANIGGGRAGGSITAACFLERFIEDDTPWAHLDIAPSAWTEGSYPLTGFGASGIGVRLLDKMVADHYES